jgi:hypothetical protein
MGRDDEGALDVGIRSGNGHGSNVEARPVADARVLVGGCRREVLEVVN